MIKHNLEKILPFILAITGGLVLVLIYFYPQLQGMEVYQLDIVKHMGMIQEILAERKAGDQALWTNRMFGGMPTFQINILYAENIFMYLNYLFTLFMPRSSGFLFLYFVGFYFLIYTITKENWVSFFGALAYSLSTYFIIIIQAGHTNKALAIGYIAPIIAGIFITYRGKYFTGGLITAIFAGTHIFANHYQITYYMLFLIAFVILGEFISSIKMKKLPVFAKASATLIVAAILALGPNLSNFIATYNYTQQSTRGKTELSFNQEQSTGSGLDKDYITQWSYGKSETLSLLIPNIHGGISHGIGEHPKAMETVDPNFKQNIAQSSAYWGEQPFTSGPVYVGAFIMLLFVFSLFLMKSWHIWSLVLVTAVAILLAWGRHYMPLTEWFIDNFPMYNKFRTVSTFMIIPQFTIPLIAVIGLKRIYDYPYLLKDKSKFFWISFALTAGLSFIIWLMPSTFFNFFSTQELSQFGELTKQGVTQTQLDVYMSNLESARIQILKADAIRSFLIILFGTAVLMLWNKTQGRIKKEIFIVLITFVLIIDLVPINKRYLNESHFEYKGKITRPYPRNKVDHSIDRDKEKNFRVLNLTVNPFNDASTSFYHNSIGGYHAAKMQRYQDLITYRISGELQTLINTFNTQQTDTNFAQSLNNTLASLNTINMLNTKYMIINPDAEPLTNPYRKGPAWFVNELLFVDNADQEILKLAEIDISQTAIVNKEFANIAKVETNIIDTNATISLKTYSANKLQYSYNSKTPQLTIFSEIYYPNGWYAYIGDKKLDVFRANYVLRAVVIPEGNHIIEFRFEPKEYFKAKKVSQIFSIIFILLLFTALYFIIKDLKVLKTNKKDKQ